MSMRTASTTQTRQNLLELQRTQQRLNDNTQRISTGNRLTSPGDDPSAAAMILDFGTSISANTQFLKQAGTASGYLTSTEDALNAAVQDVTRLMELMPSVTGTNLTASSTATVAPEVDAIRTNLLDLGNTQVQGKYIFAGTKTDTVPFVVDGSNQVTYQGDSGSISVGISAQASVVTNLNGDNVFFGGSGAGSQALATNIFGAATDLSAALKTNDQTTIKAVSANLSGILDNLNKMLSTVGGRQGGLTDMQTTLSGFNVTLQGLQDNLQATDYPAAMTQFSQDQTIQSATLSAMSKVSKTNLFDYLG